MVIFFLFHSENKGTTLHLLKKASKAVPQSRKRIKRDIYASPLEFHEQCMQNAAQEEEKHEEALDQLAQQPNWDLHFLVAGPT